MSGERNQISPTLDQLLALRALAGSEAPIWAPDGKSVAFVSSIGGAPELWSVGVEDGVLQQLSAGLGGVGHLATFLPRWLPSGEYVACVSARSGHDEVWLWPTDGGELVQLTRLGGRIEALNWAPDGRWLVVASNRLGTFDMYRVEVPSGEATQLTEGANYMVYPTVTPDGRVLFVELNDDWTDHNVVLMNADGSEPRVVLQDTDFFDYHYGRTFGYPTVAPDSGAFLFRSHRSGWINVWAAPVEGDGEPRPMAAAQSDQGEATWSPDERWIAYVENHNGTLELRVVAAGGGEPRRLVGPEMGVVSGPAWSPDSKRIAYLLGTPTAPNDLWVVDVESGARRQLTRSVLGGGFEARLAAPEKIVYDSFDGLPISAYLYRPERRDGQRAPLIMWIHGGPTSQFLDTLQPAVQFFVTQGYAVLLPNIRGSSGYGRAFEDLNNRDWGRSDLQDVIAGIEHLKSDEGIDTDNVGITGTSYGGIMSMAATVWAPAGVFRAAIACSGYGDFVHLAEEEELRHRKLMDYEYGKLPEAAEVYYRCSPIYYASQAATPCFVLHGEGRYPGSSAGRDFALALERNYKPVWYKTYPGETYYVAGTANVRRQLLDMLAFFDFHLRGMPFDFPDEATRPKTLLSGVIGPGSRSYAPPAGMTLPED